MIKLIERAYAHTGRLAIKSNYQNYTYDQLLDKSESFAIKILNSAEDLNGARIAFLVPASFEYTAIQWGIWRAGGIAVPLCEKHPLPSIEYILKDTGASIVIFSEEYKALLMPLFNSNEIVFILSTEIGNQKGSLPNILYILKTKTGLSS